jgi:hypothetical protein
MPTKPRSKNTSTVSRIETDIEKGLKKKKVQNLILEKILDQVDQERREQTSGRGKKNNSNKY